MPSASGETTMKSWLHMAAVSVCLAAPNAHAQTYPSKPITIIVPASPGGVTDMLARILAQHFNADWDAQTVVENKPGANNQVAAEYVMPPAGRRLHAVHRSGNHLHRQSDALPRPSLQALRFHPDHRSRADQSWADPASVGAGEQRQGIGRARQGQARPAELRHLRRRLERPSQYGNVQDRHRHRLWSRCTTRARRRRCRT